MRSDETAQEILTGWDWIAIGSLATATATAVLAWFAWSSIHVSQAALKAANEEAGNSLKAIAAAQDATREARDWSIISTATVFDIGWPQVPVSGELSVTVTATNLGPGHALDVRPALEQEGPPGSYAPTQARGQQEPIIATGAVKFLSVGALDVARTPEPPTNADQPEVRLVPTRYRIVLFFAKPQGARLRQAWVWDPRQDSRSLRFDSLVIDPGSGAMPMRVTAVQS